MPLQQLTTEEEVDIILTDIFADDSELQETCVRELAESLELDYEQMSESEVQEMILENEDSLYMIELSHRE